MDFTIVTPSFRQLGYLGCCISSIADQKGISVEHIVQDGGTDGFADFTQKMANRWPDRSGYRRIMVFEKDAGMYDAINRGLAKATGSICAYLNCDEQYLPGVLQKVGEAFRINPNVDLFFGDALVVDAKGNARCWRKVPVPLLTHTWTCHYSAFTAAMFFRRSLFEKGLRFDTSYKAAADAAWYLEARLRGARAGSLGFVTSTFVETGENLGTTSAALEERKRLNQTAPFWMRILRPGWLLIHRARKFMLGAHLPRSFQYETYIKEDVSRHSFSSKGLRATWPGRMWKY